MRRLVLGQPSLHDCGRQLLQAERPERWYQEVIDSVFVGRRAASRLRDVGPNDPWRHTNIARARLGIATARLLEEGL
jgi:hypothetical protein